MKIRRILLLVTCLFYPLSLAAQVTTQLDPAAAQFWKKFQNAVVQNDREAVAAMTRFPFQYPNEIDRAAFLKSYGKIFPAKTQTCFRRVKPQPDEGFFTVLCGGEAFMFGKDRGQYQFFSVESRD